MASGSPILCSDVIVRFRRGKPDAETSFCLQLLNDVALELCDRSEDAGAHLIYNVPLVAGTREYIIPGWIRLIQEVYYVNSSNQGDGYALVATDVDKLAQLMTGWREYNTSGPPYYSYISTAQADTSTVPATLDPTAAGSANVIGFEPVPQTTSGVGSPPYPCVQIYCSAASEFALTDYLPDNLSGVDAWVDQLEELFAKSQRPGEYAMRRQVGEMARQQINAKTQQTQTQDIMRINQGYIWRRRRR